MHDRVHRAGVAAGVLAAIVLLAGYFVLDGYLSAHRSVAAAGAAPVVAASAAPQPITPQAPEIVYVRPAPSPRVIHVTQTAPPSAPKVVHVTVPGAGAEPGDGSEAGGELDGGGD